MKPSHASVLACPCNGSPLSHESPRPRLYKLAPTLPVSYSEVQTHTHTHTHLQLQAHIGPLTTPVTTAGQRRRSGAADVASWCSLLALVMLVASLARSSGDEEERYNRDGLVVRGARLAARPCDELYVVAEGETLHSISARCGDPYILEQNPHVHDPDDVFPGLVIKITPRAAGNSISNSGGGANK